jgi:hypothetical protein
MMKLQNTPWKDSLMKGITKPCDIQIGNSELKKTDRKENKLTPAYEPNPYT